MKKYKATVERDGRVWLVTIPKVGSTQARHLRELDAMATDLVTVMTGADAQSVTVEYDVRMPDSVREHLERAKDLRNESARLQSEAAAEARTAARELAGTGMPLRDIGELLGVSYQRAHQLAH